MAALQCDICGGKLIGRPGGLFECDSCGMEYDTAWAKDKIQQIKGTVKVEGTVEITGSVKVENPVKVDGPVEVKDSQSLSNFIKRGKLALGDKKWDQATIFFNQALNIDAECAEAYAGLVMSHYRVSAVYKLPNYAAKFNSDFKRAKQFAKGYLLEQLEAIEKSYEDEQAEQQRKKQAAEQAKIDEQRKQEEQERRRNEKRKELEKQAATQPKDYRQAAQKASRLQQMISVSKWATVAVRADGTMVGAGRQNCEELYRMVYFRDLHQLCSVAYHTFLLTDEGRVAGVGSPDDLEGRFGIHSWGCMQQISASTHHVAGVTGNGFVSAFQYKHSSKPCGQTDVSGWRDIVAVSAGDLHTVGLQKNGKVVATKPTKEDYDFGQSEVSDWENIVAVAAGRGYTLGLRADGLVVAAGRNHNGQCDVQLWTDIIAIAAGDQAFGLRADGTVVATKATYYSSQRDVSGWTDVVAIAAYDSEVIGLRADGTVLAAGFNEWNDQVRQWKLFQSLDTVKQERIDAIRREMLDQKGLFAGKKRKALEEKIRRLEQE